MKEKQEIRTYYKKLRDEMTPEECARLSAKICSNLMEDEIFRGAEYLYAYYPLGKEADVRAAAREALARGTHVAFPKVFGDQMRFFEVSGFDRMEEGSFGIMEPGGERPADWRNRHLLVLVPGIAFDNSGCRIGFGRGYYDRYFADADGSANVTLAGIGYGAQIADNLPEEAQDRKIQYLVTEEAVFRTKV